MYHATVALHISRGIATTAATPFGAVTSMSYDGSMTYRVLLGGRFGVEIFFLISGFILALPFLQARLSDPRRCISTARFYLRRLTRLEPPYLAALLLWAVLGTALIGSPEGGSLSHVAAGALYVHHLAFGTQEPVLGVAWSLEIEMRFYLLVPLLAWALCWIRSDAMRRLAVVLLGAIALAVASLTVASILGGLWYAPFFLAGWLVADLSVTASRSPSPGTLSWDLVAIVGLILSIALFLDGREIIVIPIAPMTLGLSLIGIMRGRWARRVLARPLLTVIGGMAYSIYLIHYPVLILWGRWASTHRWAANPLGAAFAIVVTLAISVLFFAVIERQCMDPTWLMKVASMFTGRSRTRRRELAPMRVPVPSEALP
jgi:peptidoglycan/LPS O-acetylase OafA/YrhL